MFVSSFFSGFLLCAALVAAIGPQTMFVLRQGLQRTHVAAIVLFCGSADTLLVAAGVGGAASALMLAPGLATALTLGGALFLTCYGVGALRRASNPTGLTLCGEVALPLGRTLATTAAFTLLNPHVYLDAVLLMGSAGTRLPLAERPFFVAGAATASFLWFACLGFGAGRLSPLFARPGTWRLLDGFIGCVMLALASHLVLGLFSGR